MDDTDNPDRSASNEEPAYVEIFPDADQSVDPRTIGKAQYVPTVAILMIVHGVLMFVAAIGLIAMMIFISPQIGQQIVNQQEMQRQQNPNAPQFSKEGMTAIMYAVYGTMSACLFIIGIIDIWAGIRNYGYRNRILGVISLVFNMGSLCFCWCLPVSVGLLIFGMIIYLSPEADRAFRWQSLRANG